MTKSPVQTRTRIITETVIVPGDYGRLRLDQFASTPHLARLEWLDRYNGTLNCASLNANELKAAGQLLLDVADALAKGARTIDPEQQADQDRMPTTQPADPAVRGEDGSGGRVDWRTVVSEALKSASITAVATDDDGWIEWRGGDCPVGEDARVDYRLRNGNTGPAEAIRLDWDHTGTGYDIVAYRLAD